MGTVVEKVEVDVAGDKLEVMLMWVQWLEMAERKPTEMLLGNLLELVGGVVVDGAVVAGHWGSCWCRYR